jgi:hypothetical protein
MQDNTADVKPKSFAYTHLEAGDRAPFLARVRGEGLDPDQAFAKVTPGQGLRRDLQLNESVSKLLIGR